MRLSSNGNLDLNTSLNVDDDLLDGLGGSVKTVAQRNNQPLISTDERCHSKIDPTGEDLLNQTLVDAHLVGVPGLGTLTVGGLTGGDLEGLGGKTDCHNSIISIVYLRTLVDGNETDQVP